jgi:hypothetical protein
MSAIANYKMGKCVVQGMYGVIPDLPAVPSPATMNKKKRDEEEKRGKKATQHTLSKSNRNSKCNELML